MLVPKFHYAKLTNFKANTGYTHRRTAGKRRTVWGGKKENHGKVKEKRRKAKRKRGRRQSKGMEGKGREKQDKSKGRFSGGQFGEARKRPTEK